MANPQSITVSNASAEPGTNPEAASNGQAAHAEKTASASSDPEPEVARRLRAQYAEISQLAGGLAHEIRNPLSTLSLNIDLLAEDFQNPETTHDRRVLQRIQRLRHEVDRLHGIVENFLRFARVQDLKGVPTDLNTVIEELRDFFEPQAASAGIVIRTYFAPELPCVPIDVDLFKQALLNLILNAQHAMPSGGELIMTTRREANLIVLDVIDTGEGMTEEVCASIFTPFFSTRSSGSGLGLPTTRKIVEAHGGTIHVQSEPTRGSQFTIRLPLAGVETPLAHSHNTQSDSPSSSPSPPPARPL
jgi:signal transduction histidine kinase